MMPLCEMKKELEQQICFTVYHAGNSTFSSHETLRKSFTYTSILAQHIVFLLWGARILYGSNGAGKPGRRWIYLWDNGLGLSSAGGGASLVIRPTCVS